MKRIHVRIDYKQKFENGSEDDILSFHCPYKKYKVTICRDDLENYVLANLVEEQEYINLEKNFARAPFSTPLLVTIKIEDEDYKFLFQEYINYTKEKKLLDLNKIFAYIRLKTTEIYNDVLLYRKYLSKIDLDGSASGCAYCEHYSERDYCKKHNKISPTKVCDFYNFKRLRNN